MNGVAMMVGQDLYFNMPRIDDALLQKHIGAAKGFGGFGNHPLVIPLQFIGIVTPSDASATPAGCGFEHDRV